MEKLSLFLKIQRLIKESFSDYPATCDFKKVTSANKNFMLLKSLQY